MKVQHPFVRPIDREFATTINSDFNNVANIRFAFDDYANITGIDFEIINNTRGMSDHTDEIDEHGFFRASHLIYAEYYTTDYARKWGII